MQAARDSPLPSGRLVFRAGSGEFRAYRTFVIEIVIEGMGRLRTTGTWKAEPDVIEFTGYKLDAATDLSKKVPITLDGCSETGRYRYVVNGKQVRFQVIDDPCVSRMLSLNGTRWSPPGVPNTAPPRNLVRTAYAADLRLPGAASSEGSWPSFRGAHASGVADGQNLPDQWNVETGENVLWRTEIQGLAHSSPVLWGDRLFVTSAISSRGGATFKIGPYGGGESSDDQSHHQWKIYALAGC